MSYQTRSKKTTKRELDLWGKLYSSTAIPLENFPKPRAKKPKSNIRSERDEQIHFVNWMSDEGIKFYAIPNGRANQGENYNCTLMGQSPGIPDICVPYGRQGFHSLYVEMKRTKGGVVSQEQKEWIQWLNLNGSRAVVCYGADEAIKVVQGYFS